MQPTSRLVVSARARQLACSVYRATQHYPAAERFGLTAQMRRAAVSIGSNIAEGCGREGDRALVAFLQIAFGSASELEFQIVLSVDLELLTADRAAPLLAELHQLMKMLGSLISSLRRSIARVAMRRLTRATQSEPAD